MIRTLCAGIFFLLFVGCADSEQVDDRFSPGQVWAYETREGESNSRVTILKIEKSTDLTIVHIRIDDVKINNPHAPSKLSEFVPHAPIDREALAGSVTELERTVKDIPDYAEGYRTWKQNQGGVFTTSVAEIVDFVEAALNQ